ARSCPPSLPAARPRARPARGTTARTRRGRAGFAGSPISFAEIEIGPVLGRGRGEPEPAAREPRDPARGGAGGDLRLNLRVVGAQVRPVVPELVEADVQPQHGDVERNDAREEQG